VFNTVDMPPLTRLLRLTACAEGYHRVLHSEQPFTDEEHAQMVSAMLDALPNDDARQLYRAPLKYANEQSQRKRLRWLITRAATVDNRLEGQANEITGQLVDWRNDQTHLDKAREAPQSDDLLLLNAVLTYVLEANILLDLHLDVEDVGYCLEHGHAWDNPIPAWLTTRPAPGNTSQPTQ
jgi:ApeA N-terminal domain 1